MAYLMLGIVMIFLSIVFRLAAVFRLTIPLLYALIVPTVFHEWYHSNQQLGDLIGYMLLAAVALSWVISLVRKIRGILLRRREDKMLELRQADGRDLECPQVAAGVVEVIGDGSIAGVLARTASISCVDHRIVDAPYLGYQSTAIQCAGDEIGGQRVSAAVEVAGGRTKSRRD